MRELAIGDIHGCLRSFDKLLELIQPQREDTLVLLGDYVDRGPDACGVLNRILELQRLCTVVPLMGNHEVMFLHAREDPDLFAQWLGYGGDDTLASYQRRGYRRDLRAVPAPHWQFLDEQLLGYWETKERIYVHASVDPQLEMEEQSAELLYWLKFSDVMAHKSGKQIVCGHTSQKSGLPALFQGGICIDTWVYGNGWLTCFDACAQTFTQTNERGLQRTFELSKLKAR
jgi:serine/threonine protein phosphatase 1